jgi:hypothetical protein
VTFEARIHHGKLKSMSGIAGLDSRKCAIGAGEEKSALLEPREADVGDL